MIHEIFPHRFNNHYLANKKVEGGDYILQFIGNSLLLKTKGDALHIPRKKDFSESTFEKEPVFLFALDDIPCFLIRNELRIDKPGFEYREISFFRTISQQEIAWISIAGLHLKSWYEHNQFCGTCGTGMHHKGDERALICPACKTVVFPKISPAIIVAILCDDKILLARNTNFPGNWYSLIAGYVDIGESLEDALIREVKEEVGLDIRKIRYYKSQPWPLSGSMMVGFIAEADADQRIIIDDKEITEAAWFRRGNLPRYSSNISIAGEMIEKFEQGEL